MTRCSRSLVLAILLAAGCAPKALQQRVARLEERTAAVEKDVNGLTTMAADVEAVKAYFKEVSDKVRAMRDDTIRMLDEQSLRVEEGRKEYLRILQMQEKVLEDLLPALKTAIQALEKELPPAEKSLAPPPNPGA
jgi:hypothetical protein